MRVLPHRALPSSAISTASPAPTTAPASSAPSSSSTSTSTTNVSSIVPPSSSSSNVTTAAASSSPASSPPRPSRASSRTIASSSISSSSSSSASSSTASPSRRPPTSSTASSSSPAPSSISSPSPSRRVPRSLSLEGAASGSSRRRTSDAPMVSDEGYNSEEEEALSRPPATTAAPPSQQQTEEHRERELRFEKLMRKRRGLVVRRVKGDGACLFRAVADQLYGDEERHSDVRRDVVMYIRSERDHFSQFITEDFDEYARRKSLQTTFGNNLELQAVSELYNRPVEIYSYAVDPIYVIRSRDADFVTSHSPIRLSYHRTQHYNSLRETAAASALAANGHNGYSAMASAPLVHEQQMLREAIKQSAQRDVDDHVMHEARFMSDVERTEREMEEIAIARSIADAQQQQRMMAALDKAMSSASIGSPSSSSSSSSVLLGGVTSPMSSLASSLQSSRASSPSAEQGRM